MFAERTTDGELGSIRDEYAPGVLVFDCERDFETLAPRHLDDLVLRVESVDPMSYPHEWLPGEEGTPLLDRITDSDVVIGLPEHGSVTWTRQTRPFTVLVKPRVRGSPPAFVEFLIAEAFVELDTDLPEHFLGFFEERYRDFATLRLDPGDAYQLAAALYDAYIGLHTRETFAAWATSYPDLHAAWEDAGERLEPRLSDLIGAVGRGDTDFTDAAEFACSAVKHGLDLPPPFAALDTRAYREYGPDYAIRWAQRVLDGDHS